MKVFNQPGQLDQLLKGLHEMAKDAGNQPDPKTNFEKEFLDYSQKEYLKEKVLSLQQDRGERKKYAIWIFRMISVWLGIILLIILLQGFGFFSFSLSEAVLITLITTTTANIAAYFLVVTKYLFPNTKEKG